jgi:hypothetical protein
VYLARKHASLIHSTGWDGMWGEVKTQEGKKDEANVDIGGVTRTFYPPAR